jgi:hypothetical protein
MSELTARGDWRFARLRDGSVRITKRISVAPGHGFEVQQIFTPAEWVDILSHLAADQTADAAELAHRLHGHTPTDSPPTST